MFGFLFTRRQMNSFQSCPTGFESKDLRASGQVSMEVRSYHEILLLTLKAWESLERRIFANAWLVCGYFNEDHMKHFADRNDEGSDITDAKEDIDTFGCCGKGPWTPQRCTFYEWQVKDMNCIVIHVVVTIVM